MSKQVNNSGSNNSYDEFIPDQLPEIDNTPAMPAVQVQPETGAVSGEYFESEIQSVGDILHASSSSQYSTPITSDNSNNLSSPKKTLNLKKIIIFSALLGFFCAISLIIIISLN